MDILVAGAGPTGLTAAVELARRGVIPEVVDRRDAASTLSRAVGITPPSLVRLEASGVTPRLIEAGVRVREAVFYRHGERVLTLRLGGVRHRYDFILALPQDRTETILRERFEELGGAVSYGREVAAVDRTGAVRFADGDERSYDDVIGADGVRSTVRESLGLDYDGYDLLEEWGVADVDARGWPHATQFCGAILPGGGMAVVVPIGPDRYRVVANRPDALAHVPVPMAVENVRRSSTFRISIRQVPRYSVGRVHLAGDAAHCHSPVGGRGMNLGMADACDLTRRLVEGGLEGYSEARHRAGRGTIRLSENTRRTLAAPGGPRAWARDAALWLLDRARFLHPLAARRVLDLADARGDAGQG